MQGKIVKGIAGFYYVHVVEFGVYECKAKGVFRKEKIKPLVGDNVEIEILDESEKKGNIVKILPRQNELIRPAVANIDQALVVFAITKPNPHFNLLDRFLVMMESKEIPVVLCFNKEDIAKNLTLFLYPDDSDEDGRLLRIYQQYFMVSNAAQLLLDEATANGCNLHDLADYAVIQINDTHPSMVIPELIRLLTERGIEFEEACEIVSHVCAYTNHTILAEALEKWPISYLEEVVPHLMPIIRKLDERIKSKSP